VSSSALLSIGRSALLGIYKGPVTTGHYINKSVISSLVMLDFLKRCFLNLEMMPAARMYAPICKNQIKSQTRGVSRPGLWK